MKRGSELCEGDLVYDVEIDADPTRPLALTSAELPEWLMASLVIRSATQAGLWLIRGPAMSREVNKRDEQWVRASAVDPEAEYAETVEEAWREEAASCARWGGAYCQAVSEIRRVLAGEEEDP